MQCSGLHWMGQYFNFLFTFFVSSFIRKYLLNVLLSDVTSKFSNFTHICLTYSTYL